jgi:hypothetical protein
MSEPCSFLEGQLSPVAVLRYRLYGIDRIIGWVISYVLITAVFGGGVRCWCSSRPMSFLQGTGVGDGHDVGLRSDVTGQNKAP